MSATGNTISVKQFWFSFNKPDGVTYTTNKLWSFVFYGKSDNVILRDISNNHFKHSLFLGFITGFLTYLERKKAIIFAKVTNVYTIIFSNKIYEKMNTNKPRTIFIMIHLPAFCLYQCFVWNYLYILHWLMLLIFCKSKICLFFDTQEFCNCMCTNKILLTSQRSKLTYRQHGKCNQLYKWLCY